MAYEPFGTEFRVNTTTANDQGWPTITALSGGGYVISWRDDIGDASGSSIKAQIYGADGTPIGGELLINSTTASNQYDPTIVGTPDGGFIVAWTDESGIGGDSSGAGIKARIFSADGTPQDVEFRVNTSTANIQLQPAIAILEGGGFVIGWLDASGEGGDNSVYGVKAQVYAADGSPVGGEFLVNTQTAADQQQPTLAGLPGGGFVIAWMHNSGDGTYAIKAQIHDADGNRVGTEFSANTNPSGPYAEPTIALLAGGGFVVTWSAAANGDTSVYGVQAQIFAADGTPVGVEFLVNSFTGGEQSQSVVTGLPDGGFVISYVDTSGGTGYDVKAQQFAADGARIGDEIFVNTAAGGTQIRPTIATLPDGSFVISWMSSGQDGSGWGVYAQIFDVQSQYQPEGSDGNLTVDAGSAVVFSAADFGFSDQDGDAFAAVRIATLPPIGTIYYDADGAGAGMGAPISAGQIITVAEIEAGKLSYQPGPNAGLSAVFTFQVIDDSGAEDQSPNNFTMTIEEPEGVGGYQPVGSEFRVNTTTASEQLDPMITALADGGFVVVWMSYLSDGESYDIHAQRYAADGSASGPEFRVNTATEYQQYFPAVTALADGGFLVSWESLAQDAWGLYAQRYAADGSPTGAQFRINTTSPSQDSDLTITGLSDGGFVVSWVRGDDYYFFNEADVYAQRYAADGSPSGAEFRVNTTTPYEQKDPAITALADGGFVVTWQSSFQDGSGPDIYAQRYAADGSASGGEFRVNTTTAASEYFPVITALADDGFVVSWMSYPGGGGPSGIYAQRFAADGSALGPEFNVSTATTNYQLYPSITALADGGFVISWMSSGEDGSGYGIYAQRYAADGSAAGSVFLVNTTTADDQEYPTIAALSGGGFVVSWVSQAQDGDRGGIYAQRYAGTESINVIDGGPENDFLNGTAGDDQINGYDGNDTLRGNDGDDELNGGNGNDHLRGGRGVDSFDGGADDGEGFNGIGDRISFYEQAATQGAVADLRTGIISNDGFGNVETMVGIESLGGGTAYADTFYGNDSRNYLFADIGDSVYGFGGDDIVQMASAGAIVDGGADTDRLILLTSGGWFMPDADADGLAELAPEATSGWTVNLATGATLDGYGNAGTVAGFENVDGSQLGDTITGDANANVLNGGDGDDTIEGRGGNDTLDGGNGIDTASYANASGGVNVNLNFGFASGADGNDTLISIENAIGSEFNDTLNGSASGNNVLEGLGGNDNINGHAGDDTLFGGDGNDFLNGDLSENNITVSGNDIMYGGNGNDNLRGGLGDDQMYGGANNDLLRGNNGVDYFDGGTDDGEGVNGIGDRISFFEQRATQGAVADLRTGIISNDGFGNVETMVGIESLGADTAYADTFYGDDNRNYLAGNRGDSLYGFGGNDSLQLSSAAAIVDGGDGTDLLSLNSFGQWLTPDSNGDGLAESAAAATAGWSVNLAAGTMTDGYGNMGAVAGIENVDGNFLADTLTGDANANILNGFGDDDTIEGGGGDDTIDGGNGVDTASYANASGRVEVVLYRLGGGNGDSAGADGFDLLTGIENLTGSAYNDLLIGNDLANVIAGGDGNDGIYGRGGNDTLNGEGGADFINGGFGDDVIDGGAGYDRAAYFDGATSGVTVDLRLQGSAQYVGELGWDTLTNIEALSGTGFGDTLTGDEGDNWLWGSASGGGATNNDTLDGQGGNDLLAVGIGNHSLIGGSGVDTVGFTENGGFEPNLTVSLMLQGVAQATGAGDWTLTGVENLSGGQGDDALTGDGGDNVLAGNVGNDLLTGGGGNDTLYGDGLIFADTRPTGGSGPITTFTDATEWDPAAIDGNDTLEGGEGDDQLWGGGGSDTASYANASGGVQAFLYGGGYGEAYGADGYDQLHDIENLTGSAFNDQFGGDDGDNVLDGGEGHDSLRGWGGNDTLLGGAGDDFLNGGLGDDIIDGGAGYDRAAFYTDATAGVTVDLNQQGVAQDTGQGLDTLIGIENLSGTVFGDTLIGDDSDNVLWGSGSTISPGNIVTTNNDTLSGGGGNDLLWVGIGNHVVDGGSGTDTFRFNENGMPETGITLSLLLQGAAQASGNGDWILTNIENLSGSLAGDSLTGDGNDNVLAGDAGDDTLSGGGGNDTLYGDGQINWDTHGAGGSGPIVTTPDAGAGGNDTLEGGDGNDQLFGGAGMDTASYASASGSVFAFLYGGGSGEAFGAAGYDQLNGIENLTGSAFNDQLGGDDGDNVLDGGDGHDSLRGWGGNDTLLGGAGDDFLNGGLGDDTIDGGTGYDRAAFYTDATAGVTVDLNQQGVAQDTGQGLDTLIGIENVSGTVYGDTLIGDANDNVLWGSASTISLGNIATTNNDTLSGGGGNDLLWVGIGNHVVDGGSGTDTFRFNENGMPETGITLSLLLQGAAQASGNGDWILTNIENLSGSTAGDNLTGDGNANVLAGDAGDDTLSGGAGNDTLYGDGRFEWDDHDTGGSGPIITTADGGGAGNDTLEGGLGNDTLDGGSGTDTASYANAGGGVNVNLGGSFAFGADGNDTLANIENIIGSQFSDSLTGDGGNNVLEGLGGNDTLSGGAGDDTLYGGDGDDFLQGDFNENNITATGNDVMYGGNGNDLLRGGLGDDQFYGGNNNDQFRGNAGVDYFDGGADDGEGVNGIGDRVSFFEQRATQGVIADLRTGLISNDGFGNVETMVGIESLGGDTAYVDTFYGNDGRNFLAGNQGDFLYGFGGDDVFQLISASAVVDGGDGIDRLTVFISTAGLLLPDANADGLAEFAGAATAGWTVNLAAGTTLDGYGYVGTVTGIENIDGTILADSFTGDANANVLNGGDGDDTLDGGDGNDTLDGGSGNDTASFASASGGVQAQLYNGTFGEAFGAAGYDQLNNIENLTGSAHNDSLTGNNQDNVLIGGEGHDYLRGNGGNDSLYAGGGDDYLSGGAGDDLLDGGDGWDRVSFYAGAVAGVTADLRITVAQDTGVGIDTLVGIEHMSGSIYSDTLIGDAGSNWLWGTSDADGGNDTLDGQEGDDVLQNGAGDHVIIGGSGIDTFSYAVLNSTTGINLNLTLQGAAQNTGVGMMTLTGVENLSGAGLADTLIGDSGDNVLAGGGGDDTLRGGAGNDTLYGDGTIGVDTHGTGASGPIVTTADGGLGGNDLLEGGLGNDHIDGGGGTDTATYANASGSVNVNLNFGFASGADGNDTLVSIENAIGSEFGDAMTGSASGNNVLEGLGGDDTINGHAGNDTLYGGDGNDFLNGDLNENNITVSGNDVIYGGSGNDNLRGGLGDDQLYGGANNDLLRGNGGVDYFDGGTDDGLGFNGIGDRISFFEARATQGAVADLRTGIISNDGFGNVETMVGIESLGADTAYVDTFYGNDDANFLGGSLADNLYGFGGDDRFQMGAAVAVLDGGLGIDLLGLDTTGGWLTPDVNADGLAESAAAAVNGWTVNLAAGTLVDGYGNVGSVSGIENVNGSVLGDSLTGDANVNALNGFDGDDTLNGRGGDDTLDGGNGTDTASYANATGGVNVVLTATGGSASGADGSDVLISIENIIGGAFNDVLTGNGAANQLSGGDGHDSISGGSGNDSLFGGNGNDSLNGRAGDDTIDGGAGWDRVNYNVGATAGVTVNLTLQGSAQNTGQGFDTLNGIEHVVGTTFNDVITGDAGDNWLWGGSLGTGVTGNDTISGGDGNDLIEIGNGNHTLSGGVGNDTLSFLGGTTDITAAGVTFSLALAGSQNTEQGLTTASGFENLSGSVHDDIFTGTTGDNVLAGNTGADKLIGGDGDDHLYGDGGYTVFTAGGLATGSIRLVADITTEFGGVGGNDTLLGGRGNDWLYGGGGNDVMTGNQGDDVFVIEALSGVDRITDFAAGIDTIVFGASSGVDSFSDLTLTKVGNNTVITWATGDSLQIDGLRPNQLTASDFDFLI